MIANKCALLRIIILDAQLGLLARHLKSEYGLPIQIEAVLLLLNDRRSFLERIQLRGRQPLNNCVRRSALPLLVLQVLLLVAFLLRGLQLVLGSRWLQARTDFVRRGGLFDCLVLVQLVIDVSAPVLQDGLVAYELNLGRGLLWVRE